MRPVEIRELLFIFLGRGDLLLLVVFFIIMVVAGDGASGFSLLCSTSDSSDRESAEFPDNTERGGKVSMTDVSNTLYLHPSCA